MIRNLLSFFQTILGYKQASSDGIDSDTIAFCKEDRSIHTHDTDFYCGSQKLGTAAYQSTDAFSAAGHTHQYLPLSGGTMTDTINSSVKTNTHLAGNKGRVIINSTASAGSYVMLAKMNSTNGFFMHGTLGTDYRLQYTAASVVSEGKNYVSHTAKLLDEGGNTSFPGTVTAPTFSGKLNGNANTSSKWAKARTIIIGNKGKSVNGSSNVSWSLSEIGAAPINHTHEYLPLSGGTVNGDTTITGTLSNGDGISTDGGLRVGGSSSFVGTATFDSNAVMNAPINSSVNTHTHIAGNQGGAIINSLANAGSYVMLAKMNSTNGFFTHGTFGTDYRLQYTAASVVSEGKNETTHTAYLLKEDGNTHFPGTVTAPTFSGNLNGNAATASKWNTARTITIGNTGKSVDGSSNVAWSLSEIGAAPTNHTHDYAPTNHTHTYLPLNGNADTASKWNTARTITIGNTGKSVDGSSNVSWSLSEIGAAPASHTHPYLPTSGGAITGNLGVQGDLNVLGDVTFNEGTLTAPNIVGSLDGIASRATVADSVAWGNVTEKPATYTPASHSHNDLYYTESEIDTKLNAKSNTGHTHDDRYYTESEIDTKLNAKSNTDHTHNYLPLSGGFMTGNIWYTGLGTSYIGLGRNDGANEVGGELNNIVISSWYGVSFTTSCGGQKYSGTNAVSIDCRNGIVYAEKFIGSLQGNAATATKASSADSVSWSNVTGKPVAYQPVSHNHDDRYYTESEIDTKLNAKSNTDHTHAYLSLTGGKVTGDLGVSGELLTKRIESPTDNSILLGSGTNAGYIAMSDDLVGNSNPTNAGSNWCIEFGGDAFFSSVSQTSDQRLKENIHDVEKSFTEKYWATENGLIHEYDWKKSGKHATGMIAQELLNYIPESVKYNQKDDSYSVDYTIATCKIIGAMFKKIKELEETIHALEER